MIRLAPIYWPLWGRRLFVLTGWPMLVLFALVAGLTTDIIQCAQGTMRWRDIDDDIRNGLGTAVFGACDLWRRQPHEKAYRT